MSLTDFAFGKELGRGAFSSVHVVKRKVDGKVYAMKRVQISQLNTKERENALNEIRLLASFSHVNIIGYKEAFYDQISQTINIVMELADDGDISAKVKEFIEGKLYFRESTIWSILAQMLQGLRYLHDNHIMHRDLKSANVFLMKNGTAKIGDLNVSKITRMGMASTQTGTPFYASPEVWNDKPYDYKSDVWSLGCIVYEMCTLKTPFRGATLPEVFAKVVKGAYEHIPYIYSKELAKVISYMLQVDPSARLTSDQLLKMDVITEKIKLSQSNENSDALQAEAQVELLKTIKVPKNLREINKTLPGNQYDSHKANIHTCEGYISRKANGSSKDKQFQKMNSCNNSVIKQSKRIQPISKGRLIFKPEDNNHMHHLNHRNHDNGKYKILCTDINHSVSSVNHSLNIVYCKPIVTNANDSKLQKAPTPKSKIIIIKNGLVSSPTRNKVIASNPTSNLKQKDKPTPIRLFKNGSPSQLNKSSKRFINRPVSSMSDNKLCLITPYAKKTTNKQPKHPLSPFSKKKD